MIPWNYHWTDEHGVEHHYPKLFGWRCDIHDRVCSPFAPLTTDDILRRAANDPKVTDEMFVVLRQAAEGREVAP